jgi:hypothetical protein
MLVRGREGVGRAGGCAALRAVCGGCTHARTHTHTRARAGFRAGVRRVGGPVLLCLAPLPCALCARALLLCLVRAPPSVRLACGSRAFPWDWDTPPASVMTLGLGHAAHPGARRVGGVTGARRPSRVPRASRILVTRWSRAGHALGHAAHPRDAPRCDTATGVKRARRLGTPVWASSAARWSLVAVSLVARRTGQLVWRAVRARGLGARVALSAYTRRTRRRPGKCDVCQASVTCVWQV